MTKVSLQCEDHEAPEAHQSPLTAGMLRLIDEPTLADGTALSVHQVDALEGSLSALLDGDRRLWFEHATGSGKTVSAMGFVDANPGRTLILTHRRNLVDQFTAEVKTRGYAALAERRQVVVQTYQWLVRHAETVTAEDFDLVICDEVHTALGEKTSSVIRSWDGPVWIGMTATGQLIARAVSDLFPVQTSTFDLDLAAKRGVISPLRGLRVAPGPYVNSIASIPIRRTDTDQEFDQGELAALLDQGPFNFAAADYYRATFRDTPGVVYAAGVEHAQHVAEAFEAVGLRAVAVSGQTPAKELDRVLARYAEGEVDVLVNAQLLVEGWNAPRATVCMHLAPTASRRVYQQRIGRVTRLHADKEAGIVVDFVHPGTTHNHPIVTLHSLVGRDVYRSNAVVVGYSRRRRPLVKVDRRLLPVSASAHDRREIIEREWERILVESLTPDDARYWVSVVAERMNADRWSSCIDRATSAGDEVIDGLLLALVNNPTLAQRALKDIAARSEPHVVHAALEAVHEWDRAAQLQAARTLLSVWSRVPARKQWLWTVAGWSRGWHERAASSRWNDLTRLLGSLTNAVGPAHARCVRRIIQESNRQPERVRISTLAALKPHTPEGENVISEARNRTQTPPRQVAALLLKNLPANNQAHERVGGEPKTVARARRHFVKEVVEQQAAVGSVRSHRTADGWVLRVSLGDDGLDLPAEWMGVRLECTVDA